MIFLKLSTADSKEVRKLHVGRNFLYVRRSANYVGHRENSVPTELPLRFSHPIIRPKNILPLYANMQSYMIRRIMTIVAVCATLLSATAQPKYEIRAVWLTTLGGMDWPGIKANTPENRERQKEELRQVLDRLQAAHFNTVLLQTRLRGDLIYPSKYETFPEALTGFTGKNPGYDVLRFAIDECHKRGMELHAWLVSIPIGNARQVRLLGKESVVKKQPQLCKRFEDSWYLDPGQPGTADYLSDIAEEITRNYDIDGIHLDYIRYPENGRRFPDNDTYRKYGKGQPKDEWRRQNITHIVSEIYRTVKALKPWVKVSSSPIGKFNDTQRYSSRGWNGYAAVYQDAQNWLQAGIHDAVFPMMYFTGNQFYPFALDWVENSNHRFVVPGLGIYFLHPAEKNWKLDEIGRQIYFSRQHGASGQAYFRNRFLLDNTKQLLDELQTNFYRYPAVVPPMTWQDSIAPLPPSHPQWSTDGERTTLSWQAATHPHGTPLYYRVYASNRLPVDITRPQNIIAERVAQPQFSLPANGNMPTYWAVTAVDRMGNESQPLAFTPDSVQALSITNELPRPIEGQTLLINDLTGYELARLTTFPQDIVQWCHQQGWHKGIYRYQLISVQGKTIESGMWRLTDENKNQIGR